MKLGICTPLANAPALQAAGYDYVEESVQGLLHAHDQAADQWHGADQAADCPLPIPAANLMVPASHKITGPDADPKKLATYMSIMLSRAQRVGLKTIVFGSGGARQVPDGWPREKAYDQIVSFLRSAAPVAEQHNVTIVIEPLNKTECNILNGIIESRDVAKRVNHPHVKILWDTYHHWMDNQPANELTETLDMVHHIHLADKEGRVPPGLSGKSDYKPVFKLLKSINYKGLISIEAPGFNVPQDGAKVAQYVRSEWDKA